MRPPAHLARSSIVSVCVALVAMSCSREPVLTSVSIQAPLTSSTGNVVFALVEAVQGEDRVRVELHGNEDAGVLQLRVGESATITGTVFVFTDNAWFAYSNTQIIMPDVGTTKLPLVLAQAPQVSGTLVPTATVRGTAEAISDAPTPLTITDLATQWTVVSPFTTNQTLTFPSGRAIVVQIDDHFGGGTATRTLDTATFTLNTPIPVQADATIAVVNDDLTALLDSITPLQTNALGLECSVNGTCSGTSNFAPCDPSALALPTENPYSVAIRYAKVAGSCVEARVVRDLTPPGYTSSFDPPLLPSGATQITLILDATEPVIAEQTTVKLSAASSTICTPTALSPTRVSCSLNLQGVAVSGFIDLIVELHDRGGLTGKRTSRLRARSADPIQVVGYSTYPGTITSQSGAGQIGITFGIYDKKNLCGIGLTDDSYALNLVSSTGVAFDSYLNQLSSDFNAIADTSADVTLVTVFSRFSTSDAPADVYDMAMSFTFSACGSRPETTVAFADKLTIVEGQPSWVGAPYVFSSNYSASSDYPPVINLRNSDVESQDETIARIDRGEGTFISAYRAGKTKFVTVPYDDEQNTDPVDPAISADVEVVSPTGIVAIQDLRLVRRSPSSDAIVDLPAEIGVPVRVLWESTRNLTIAVGTGGVTLLASSGAETTLVNPCGGEQIDDATLTAVGIGHGSAQPDLVVLTHDADLNPMHCDIDLTRGIVTASAGLDTPGCDGAARIAVDDVSNLFIVAGTGCAASYERTGLDQIVVRDTTTFATNAPSQLTVSGRYALAVVTDGVSVVSLDLSSGLAPHPFNTTPYDDSYAFSPTAVAVHPLTGTVWVAGQANGIAFYMGYSDRHGGSHFSEQTRTDLTSRSAPNRLLFDGSNHTLYSSLTSYPPALLSIDSSDLVSYYDIASTNYPLRTWPDGLPIIDMALVGPQPIGTDTQAVIPGQRMTIVGDGFAGQGLDRVYVMGVLAQTVTSTPNAVTFVVPPALARLNEAQLDAISPSMQVRSNGLMSGSVVTSNPYAGGGNALAVLAAYPGHSLSGYGPTTFTSYGAGPTYMLDTGGDYYSFGLYAAQPLNPYYGVTRLDAEAASALTFYSSSFGFATPVQIPGVQRMVGVLGSQFNDAILAGFNTTINPPETATSKRTRAYTGSPIVNLTAAKDGSLLAAATASAIDFYWPSTLLKTTTPSVVTNAHDFLHLGTSGLLITASKAGEIVAFRVASGTSTLVTITSNTSSCPSGARTGVLALRGDVYSTNSSAETALALTTYAGGIVAAEEIVTTTSGTTIQCRSFGRLPVTPVVAGIDPTGLRIAIVDTAHNARSLDTRDLKQTRYVNPTLVTAPQGLLFTKDGSRFVVYDNSTFMTHSFGI